MTIKNIIKNTATYLGLNGVLKLPALGGTENDAQAERDLNLLLRCANLVYKGIAAEFIPLIATEEVVSGGSFEYTDLSRQVADIIEIRDKNNVKINFTAYPGFVSAEKGTLRVKYSYIPADCAITGQTDYKSKIDERIFAFGVASEYCIISGMYDEASVWNNRFVNGITTVCGKKAEMRIASRRWL